MEEITDGIIVFMLMLVFILFEEIETLLKPKTQRVLPVKKSKTELKRMLKGDLIELVISYQ
tara:strand:- start:3501 stop:3683 length:183 start_codon:yes stop_codon:yes gene_type:complete